ncbi:MAG: hypothetical protein M3Q15_06810 [Pseudomonadota bacterium]|nr:hypothetical protein [Pseudomonadota bacterium]
MGLATAALGLGAGLLPLAAPEYGGSWIGWSLILAGSFELIAGLVKGFERGRYGRLTAGAITLIAGLFFIANPLLELFPIASLIVAWLTARGALLFIASHMSLAPLRRVTTIAAIADIALAITLIFGLPAAVLVSSVFGPTPELVRNFGWVFAASFFVTGVSLVVEPFLRLRGTGSENI